MKLELKHLAAYLPYKLKVKNKECDDVLTLIELDRERVGSMDDKFKYIDWIGDIKPILHPLSDLVKEIEINGESFVPIEKLQALEDYVFDEEAFLSPYWGNMPYEICQMVLEWHFDIFGLIKEGLAIDINSLKTE